MSVCTDLWDFTLCCGLPGTVRQLVALAASLLLKAIHTERLRPI